MNSPEMKIVKFGDENIVTASGAPRASKIWENFNMLYLYDDDVEYSSMAQMYNDSNQNARVPENENSYARIAQKYGINPQSIYSDIDSGGAYATVKVYKTTEGTTSQTTLGDWLSNAKSSNYDAYNGNYQYVYDNALNEYVFKWVSYTTN